MQNYFFLKWPIKRPTKKTEESILRLDKLLFFSPPHQPVFNRPSSRLLIAVAAAASDACCLLSIYLVSPATFVISQ